MLTKNEDGTIVIYNENDIYEHDDISVHCDSIGYKYLIDGSKGLVYNLTGVNLNEDVTVHPMKEVYPDLLIDIGYSNISCLK